MIYLDHNATTMPSLAAESGIYKALDWWGNPNSTHLLGTEPAKLIKRAEESILNYINGHNGRIIWTANGSEANRLAIQAICQAPGDLLTSSVEHKSVEEMRYKYASETIPADEFGRPNAASIYSSLESSNRTKLLSLILVNNETGAIANIWGLAPLCWKKQVLLHIDGVQGAGRFPLDVEKMGCDSLALSAHKIYGPKGIGCLWVKSSALQSYASLLGLHPGTPNTPGIIGFGNAISQLNNIKYRQELIIKEDIFLRELRSTGTEFYINFDSPFRMPGTLSLRFPGVDGAELAFMLSDQWVYVSTGSACNAGEEDYRVLLNSGLVLKQAKETIRVSLGRTCSCLELFDGAEIISDTVEELRNG